MSAALTVRPSRPVYSNIRYFQARSAALRVLPRATQPARRSPGVRKPYGKPVEPGLHCNLPNSIGDVVVVNVQDQRRVANRPRRASRSSIRRHYTLFISALPRLAGRTAVARVEGPTGWVSTWTIASKGARRRWTTYFTTVPARAYPTAAERACVDYSFRVGADPYSRAPRANPRRGRFTGRWFWRSDQRNADDGVPSRIGAGRARREIEGARPLISRRIRNHLIGPKGQDDHRPDGTQPFIRNQRGPSGRSQRDRPVRRR
jgi:hypothetical protein